MYYSTKSGGFIVPASLREIHDFYITHEPQEYIGDETEAGAFAQIYGIPALDFAKRYRRVPENNNKYFVGPGAIFEVGTVPAITGIPAPGEPEYIIRIEAKLDQIIAKLG